MTKKVFLKGNLTFPKNNYSVLIHRAVKYLFSLNKSIPGLGDNLADYLLLMESRAMHSLTSHWQISYETQPYTERKVNGVLLYMEAEGNSLYVSTPVISLAAHLIK